MTPLTTGQLAKKTGVHTETIRYYERLGLMPIPARLDSGYRQYDLDDVKRIRFIKHAQKIGFSLKEIADLLSLRITPETSCDDVRRRAIQKSDTIKEKIRTLKKMQTTLEKLIAACEKRTPTEECPILEILSEQEKGEQA